jgi:hypothetical protein
VGENQGAPFVELLGDPTLRMTIVKPVNVSDHPLVEAIDLSNGHVTLTWDPSPEDVTDNDFIGYQVYRSDSLSGVFTAVGSRVAATMDDDPYTFSDTTPSGDYVYMVRAIKLETTPSGKYENASTGVFAPKIVVDGTDDDDDIYIKHGETTDDPAIQLWGNAPLIGAPNYTLDGRVVTSIEVAGGDGDDAITIDLGTTSHVVTGGILVAGGSGADDVLVLGSTVADTMTIDGGTSLNTNAITVGGVESVALDGAGGGDSVTINLTSPAVTVGGDQVLKTLTIGTGAQLDLGSNDMIIKSGSSGATNQSAVEGYIASGRNSGAWNGDGIISSAAANNSSTGLGVLSGAKYTGFGGSTFAGQSYLSTDTLVKYTWNGDTNFTGTVDFDDYVNVDVGFNTSLTGWANGDLNYSGAVNFDDYVLIDIAFNTQTGPLFGGEPTAWQQIAQMDHFSEGYMNYLIDQAEKYDIYLTPEDFSLPG